MKSNTEPTKKQDEPWQIMQRQYRFFTSNLDWIFGIPTDKAKIKGEK